MNCKFTPSKNCDSSCPDCGRCGYYKGGECFNIPPIENKSQIAMQHEFYAKSIEAIKEAQELNRKTRAIYEDLQKYGLQNGPYYDGNNVHIEEGFNTDNMAPYTIVRIRHNSQPDCKPIFVKLHTAYNNTTNSGIKENAFNASENELAQILIPAVNANEWYGYTSNDGAPLVSIMDNSKWTFGFTKHGKMKVYDNQYLSENENKLRNDCIVWSIGCDNILILNGERTNGRLIENIGDYDESNSRVIIGQNYSTKDTFIFVCGGGISCKNAVDVMLGYGVDVAVQTISGDNSIALNQGGLMFTPHNNEISSHIAYVYISKKDFFKNALQWDIAKTIQLLNQTEYLNELNNKANSETMDELKSEIKNRKSADTNIRNDMANADKTLQDNINTAKAELDKAIVDLTTAMNTADTSLQALLDNEINRAKEKEKELEESLQFEVTRASDVESELRTDIDTEITRSMNEDSKLSEDLLSEITRAKKQESDLFVKCSEILTKLNEEITRSTNEDNFLFEQYNASLTDVYNKINTEISRATDSESNVLGIVRNNKSQFESYKTESDSNFSSIEQSLSDLRSIANTLNEQYNNVRQIVDNHSTELSALDMAVTSVQLSVSNMETAVDNLKSLYEQLKTEQESLDNRVTANEDTISVHSSIFNELVDATMNFDITEQLTDLFNGERRSVNLEIPFIENATYLFDIQLRDETSGYGNVSGVVKLKKGENIGCNLVYTFFGSQLTNTINYGLFNVYKRAEDIAIRNFDPELLELETFKIPNISSFSARVMILANFGDLVGEILYG